MPPALSGSGAQQVMVRMDRDMHKQIKSRAAREDRTMAQAIRHAVRLYLEADSA